MSILTDDKKTWRMELERFISHWERETEVIKGKTLNPDECCKISEMFHKDGYSLLARKPAEIEDDEAFVKIDKLDNKLNVTLAMVCGYSE